MSNEFKPKSFGYSEMYEWAETPEQGTRLGKFVTFSKDEHEKIEFVNDKNNSQVLGVTTINSTIESDNPDDWANRYMCNEYGDLFLQNESLAVGEKVYDENLELSFIRTRKWDHLVMIENKEYDNTKQYVKRTNRQEWVRVNLIGKCVVEDDGTCVAGQYCTPYTGKVKKLFGTAVPASDDSKHKFYVLGRISDKTIMILNK